jgi:hypothetical protein
MTITASFIPRFLKKGQRQKDWQEIKAEAKKLYGNIPGVEGFGIGDDSLLIYIQDSEVQKDFTKEKMSQISEGSKFEFIITGKISGH